MLDTYLEFSRKTAIYPDAGKGSLASLAYVTLGHVGEVGEFANKFKKVLRGDKTLEQAREDLIDEMGDEFWYWVRKCDELKIHPSEVMRLNMEKLKRRLAAGTIQGDGDDR